MYFGTCARLRLHAQFPRSYGYFERMFIPRYVCTPDAQKDVSRSRLIATEAKQEYMQQKTLDTFSSVMFEKLSNQKTAGTIYLSLTRSPVVSDKLYHYDCSKVNPQN